MSPIFNSPVIVAALMLLLASAVALTWLSLRDGRLTLTAILVMLLPLVLLLAGLFTSGGDRSQIGIAAWGLTTLGLLIPAYYVLQSGPDNWFAQWRFLLAYGALYLAMLPFFMMWIATRTAYASPAPGIAPVSGHRLERRLRSLAGAGLDLAVERRTGEPDQMLVTRTFRDGKRTIGVRLTLLSERPCVLAREVSLIRGDKPMNADEARMRSGPHRHDGVHPDADLVYSARLTVTPPSAAIRRQIALRIVNDRVEIASGAGAASDPDNLTHLLTVLVHQSGWSWQGVFFDWQRGCGEA